MSDHEQQRHDSEQEASHATPATPHGEMMAEQVERSSEAYKTPEQQGRNWKVGDIHDDGSEVIAIIGETPWV